MVRERGSGITPPRVVELLKKEVAEKGLINLEEKTGVGKSALNRYVKGIGEPTTATLEKLADYFRKSVAWLRGDTPDTIMFNSYPWPANYDMWAIMLSTTEGILLSALESREEMKKDRVTVETILKVAHDIVDMPEEQSLKYLPEHLAEVKKKAYSVIEAFTH